MKFKKNKLTLLIFTLIVISTAIIFYILKPINLFKFILFLIYVFLEIFLFRLWILSTYGFICINCGNTFNIGILKRILFFKENKECPKCKSRNIVKEHLWSHCLHSWNDLDED